MSTTIVRPMVSEENFNKVFELVKISNNKIGFDTALTMVLEKMVQPHQARNKFESKQNFSKGISHETK